MGIFNFKKKNKDGKYKPNTNREEHRLMEIFTISDRLSKKKLNIMSKLNEENFYYRDNTHLSLLDKLKEVDDETQKLISEKNRMLKNSTSDSIQTMNKIFKSMPGEDEKPVPPELWNIFQRKGNRDSSSNELIQNGKEAYEAEDLDQAIKCFKKALTINPNDPDTLISLGIAYIDNNNNHDAISSFKKAIDIRPNHAETYFILAGAYNDIEKYDDEIDCYNKTIRLEPNHADAYFCLGIVYGLKGQDIESIQYYRKYLEIDPLGDKKEFVLNRLKEVAIKLKKKAVKELPEELIEKMIKLQLKKIDTLIQAFLLSIKLYPGLDNIMNDEQKRTKMLHFLMGVADFSTQSLEENRRLISDEIIIQKILNPYFEKMGFRIHEIFQVILLQTTGGDMFKIDKLNLPYNGKDMFDLILEGGRSASKINDTEGSDILLQLGRILH